MNDAPLSLALQGGLALALRLAAAGLIAARLRPRCRGRLEAGVAGWILMHLGTIALLAGLSVIGGLTRAGLAGAGALALGALALAPGRRSMRDFLTDGAPLDGPSRIAFAATAALLLALIVHATHYFDTTWDALVYGLARVSIWANRGTIFFHAPSLARNLFCNEWNTELGALYYVVATGRDQAALFAPAEAWLFLVAAFAWAAGALGAPRSLQGMIGLLAAGAPVVLALSMTVKGEPLACGALAAAAGWLLRPPRGEDPDFGALMAVAALALAGGAKVTVLPAALLLLTLLAWREGRDGARPRARAWLAGAALFAAGCSCYLVNLLVYGNPVARAPNEKMQFFAGNGPGNLLGLAGGLLAPWWHPPVSHETFYAVYCDAGLLGILVFALPVLARAGRPREGAGSRLSGRAFALVLAAAALLPLLSTWWRPWSFRYYAPWVMMAVCAVLARTAARCASGARASAFTLAALAILGVHAAIAFQPGELNPPGGLAAARGRNQLERKLAFHPGLLGGECRAASAPGARGAPATILIFNALNTPVYPFLGDDHATRADFTDSLDGLVQRAAAERYDAIVLTRLELADPAAARLAVFRYRPEIRCDRWVVFVPE